MKVLEAGLALSPKPLWWYVKLICCTNDKFSLGLEIELTTIKIKICPAVL